MICCEAANNNLFTVKRHFFKTNLLSRNHNVLFSVAMARFKRRISHAPNLIPTGSTQIIKFDMAFTCQTNVGQLVLAISNWCV